MLAEAIGKSGNTQIVHLPVPSNISQDHFAAYAIYERRKLARVALINFAQFNKTSSASRQGVQVKIAGSTRNTRLKRMTAPGIDEKNTDLVTWAGQAYTNGTASGKLQLERVPNDVVWIADSEAALIFL